jgi:hypothetical protein
MAFANSGDPWIDYLIISSLGGCYTTPIIQIFQDGRFRIKIDPQLESATHARKDEDGLLLEFPCNPTRTLYRVVLLGLLPCNRLGTRPLDYIKDGRVPSRAPNPTQHQAQGAILDPQTGRRVRHLGDPNLYKSCVSCPCAYLRVLGLPVTIPTAQSTTLGTPLVGLPV